MDINVTWEKSGKDKKYLEWNRCLYAYLDPESYSILYIGKANRHTVDKRFYAIDKESLKTYFKNELKLDRLIVIIGVLYIEEGRRFSSELLSDIESLLIMRLKPPGNIQCKRSRISRPGLRVLCEGYWPTSRKSFFDRG